MIITLWCARGVKSLLESEGVFGSVGGKAGNGQDLVRIRKRRLAKPESSVLALGCLLMKRLIAGPGIKRVCPNAENHLPDAAHDEDQYVIEALRAGIRGYFLKNQAGLLTWFMPFSRFCRGQEYL